MTPFVLRASALTKVYAPTVAALREVELDIRRGELCFFVGPSGAGKSTLFALAIAQEPPSAGELYVAGYPVHLIDRREIPGLRRRIGVVFQDFKLLEERTVAENVAFALELRALPGHVVRSRTDEVLELVGLAQRGRHFPHQISGGEAQRAAIARAIVAAPDIVLADEPTGDLDPETSQEIVGLLRAIHRRGTTVLIATHDPEIIGTATARVVGLRDGRKVLDGEVRGYPRELLRAGAGR